MEARTGPRARPVKLAWQLVPIEAVRTETPRIKSCLLRVGWSRRFRAGQHVDVRLTAADGYQAQRSYSIASAPADSSRIELMIERLDDGEVSGYFHDVARVGDTIELRGPIGDPFTWDAADRGPVLLVGGGSGMVPLLSMLRHRAQAAPQVPMLLLASARSAADLIARDELLGRAREEAGFDLLVTLTRDASGIALARDRRLDRALVAEALARLPGTPAHAYVCGSNPFVGAAAELLLDAGVPAAWIHTERFGG